MEIRISEITTSRLMYSVIVLHSILYYISYHSNALKESHFNQIVGRRETLLSNYVMIDDEQNTLKADRIVECGNIQL